MKVYILVDDEGLPGNCDVIQGVFVQHKDAEDMLKSFKEYDSHGNLLPTYRIEEHEVIE